MTAPAIDMIHSTVLELRKKLDAKELSALELAQAYLERITHSNPTLNSFITVNSEQLFARAEHADREIAAGNQGPLTGIPYAAKDLFCTKGVRTTAGSHILDTYTPPYNATAIEKCGDAVLLGKTNLDEFAMGSSNEHSAFGPVKNPYDLSRVPGGSSGGSAAAVAAEQAPFAFGTDTGGSIRLPASFCNVVGLKPAYGRISRYGVISMASSLDTVGFFTRTIADAAYLLQILAGDDVLDATTPAVPVPEYSAALETSVNGMRIGVPKEYLDVDGLDVEIKELYQQTVRALETQGALMQEVSLPHTMYALPTYYILCPSEVSSNMARYDGMQFGKRAADATTLDEVFTKTRAHGFGAEVKRRMIIGTYCLSSGYYDAYYKKAQQVRTLIREDFTEAFTQVDLLLSPTSPFVPFKIGERLSDPLAMYLADIYTVPAPLAGVPALSVPVGAVRGLPVGMQLIAPQFKEGRLFTAGHALEQLMPRPNLPLAV